ncbi:MAG: 50S ribosomal protein L17 [Vicinamibacteria bacterium]
MRHRAAGRKLGRTTSHRIALLRNLATALIREERIETTLPKAKELRPFAEKIITLARREGTAAQLVHARRLAARDIHDPIIVKKLFDVVGTRFQTRNGGYTRIIKLGHRAGDNADVALIELVGYEYKAKDKASKGSKEAASAPATK